MRVNSVGLYFQSYGLKSMRPTPKIMAICHFHIVTGGSDKAQWVVKKKKNSTGT